MTGEGGCNAKFGFTLGLGTPTKPEPVAAGQIQGSASEGRSGGVLDGQS